MKKKLIAGLLVVIIVVFSCCVSYVNFKVANPITTAVALCRVIFTDTDYVVVKDDPKIVFVKADYTLAEYMEIQGYKEDVEKRDGSMRTFVTDGSEVTIHRSYNNVFGMWHWVE